ncbi:FtsX-like permease family protein [Oceanivirga salmonicida]|uniref:FtsX-like permease family protein n=1 Tax=Oceanivirga salmonicida TaxID=1769291 RepID=UPI0018CC6985|nr:ABC transporter permease [Oceanivirga salmonicida]
MKSLILKNIKANKTNYLLQLFVLTFIASVLYAFINLSFSDELLNISQNMTLFKNVVWILVILTAYFSGIIVSYVSKYMLIQRNREFSTYILLGIKRKIIAKIFFFENLIVSLISYIIGIFIGGFISRLLSVIVNNVFNRNIITLNYISVLPIFFTLALVLAIIIVSTMRTIKRITKDNLIKLLYADKESENINNFNSRTNYLLLILSIALIITSFYYVNVIMTSSTNSVYLYMLLMIISLITGLYLLQANLLNMFLGIFSKKYSYVYKSNNLYFIKNIKSKFSEKKKIISIITIIATISMLSMVIAIIFSSAYKINIEKEYPYDITVGMDIVVENFNDIENFIDTKHKVEDKYFFYLYDVDKRYVSIKLSDYNNLREFLGYDKVVLEQNEYLIHSENDMLKEETISKLNESDNIISSNELKLNNKLPANEPLETYRTAGKNGVVIVLNDTMLYDIEPNKSRIVFKMKDELNLNLTLVIK